MNTEKDRERERTASGCDTAGWGTTGRARLQDGQGEQKTGKGRLEEWVKGPEFLMGAYRFVLIVGRRTGILALLKLALVHTNQLLGGEAPDALLVVLVGDRVEWWRRGIEQVGVDQKRIEV